MRQDIGQLILGHAALNHSIKEADTFFSTQIMEDRKRLSYLEKIVADYRRHPPNDEAKRTSVNRLMEGLFQFLEQKYENEGLNGIYFNNLYNKRINKRYIKGLLDISKTQAFRLKAACRNDKRFKITKADKYQGREMIKLNRYIK